MAHDKTPPLASDELSAAFDVALASLPFPLRKVAEKALQEQIGQFVRDCMDEFPQDEQ